MNSRLVSGGKTPKDSKERDRLIPLGLAEEDSLFAGELQTGFKEALRGHNEFMTKLYFAGGRTSRTFALTDSKGQQQSLSDRENFSP